MAVGALRHMDGFAVIGGNSAVHQFLATLAASHGTNAHTTFLTSIRRHVGSPFLKINYMQLK